MEEWKQRSGIRELQGTANVSYLMEENSCFSLTMYKMLKGQEDSKWCLKTAKVLFNGRVKLMYFTSGYKSLAKLLVHIGEKEFLQILTSLLSTVLEIRENGFLICSNLELSAGRIFVDQNTLGVKLIYLPLAVSEDYTVFESTLRESLTQMITAFPALSTVKMQCVCEELSNAAHSLRETCKVIQDIAKGDGGGVGVIPPTHGQPVLELTSMENGTVFLINKEEYVIGRGGSVKVDGCIDFNTYVGRIHCKIVFEDHEYGIVDLNSMNGTFLNGNKLSPDKLYRVLDGDVIRMANSNFRVRIQGI